MSNNKDFYKFIINTLVKSKIENDPSFESNLEKFATKIDNEISHSTHLQGIEQGMNNIGKRIFVINKKITADAEYCYAGILRKSLRKRLITAYENMAFSTNNLDIKSSCKYLIVQAELLSTHLAFEVDLINWIAQNTPSGITVSQSSKGPYLSTWNLLKAVDRRFLIQFDENLFYEIKQLRDYESHGYHEDMVVSMESLLSKVASNWQKYQDEGLRFVDQLITEQYNYP